MFFAALGAAAAVAQTGETRALTTRIERLEGDLRQLQRDYYSGSGQTVPSGPTAESERLSERVQAIEDSLRNLTGQVEEMNFRQRGLDERLQRLELKLGVETAPGAAPPGGSGSAVPPGSPTPLGSANPGAGTLGTLSVPAEPAAETPKDEKGQYEAALDTLYRGDQPGGIQALKAFIDAHPKSDKVPDAYYYLGETYLAQEDYRAAGDAFNAVVTKYPKNPQAPKSLVKLGSTFIKGGQVKDGCKLLQSIKEMFPKAPESVLDMAKRERQMAKC